MSEVTIDTQRVMDALAGAFDHANDQVVADLHGREVKRTGRLAASFTLSETFSDGRWWWNYVRSALPYARPVERGAWVGAGHNRPSPRFKSQRGPHMRGNFIVKKTVQAVYGAAVKSAMPAGYKPKRTFIKGARIVYR